MFKREPPEGCERVKVFTEETQSVLLLIACLSPFSLFFPRLFSFFLHLLVLEVMTVHGFDSWLSVFDWFSLPSPCPLCVCATQGQTSTWDPAVLVPRQKQGQLHPQQRLCILPGQHSQAAQPYECLHWGWTESVPRHQHPVPVALLLLFLFPLLIQPRTTESLICNQSTNQVSRLSCPPKLSTAHITNQKKKVKQQNVGLYFGSTAYIW